jgi:hypothetical protein
MAKTKKEQSPETEETTSIEVPGLTQKEKIFDLLKNRIPGLFDRHPNGSISINALLTLVDDLLEIE